MEEDPEVETLKLPSSTGGVRVIVSEEPAASGGEGATSAQDDGEGGNDSDPELDALLDQSLGEFGKHVPTPQHPKPSAAKATPSAGDQPHPPPQPPLLGDADLEDIFSSEFAAAAEAQLGEAMKMMSSENPELWQQFETFAKSMGLDEMGVGGSVPLATGAASKGESTVDIESEAKAGAGGGGAKVGEGGGGAEGRATGEGGSATLDQKLDETIRRLQDNAAKIGPEGKPEGLHEMLSQMDLGSEEGEDHFMKMMQGMMSTLLSKEVLYPSLVDLCKQYPDWLSSHQEGLSEEDYQRYSKQLQVMKTICKEFEDPAYSNSSSDKILQLMQQLQQYGQPPEDLAGETLQPPGIPPGLQEMMGGSDPQNCTIM